MPTIEQLQPVQQVLFEESFGLEAWQIQFVHTYIENGGDGPAAYLAAKPGVKRSTAKSESCRMLAKNDEVKRYLRRRLAEVSWRQQLTEDELVAKSRRVYDHAVGDQPVAKSLVSKEGKIQDVQVREPNLTAANTAVETLRKLGGFGDRDDGLAGDAERARLSGTERAARVAALLERGRREPSIAADGWAE